VTPGSIDGLHSGRRDRPPADLAHHETEATGGA
jgi:hypothetical protein